MQDIPAQLRAHVNVANVTVTADDRLTAVGKPAVLFWVKTLAPQVLEGCADGGERVHAVSGKSAMKEDWDFKKNKQIKKC